MNLDPQSVIYGFALALPVYYLLDRVAFASLDWLVDRLHGGR